MNEELHLSIRAIWHLLIGVINQNNEQHSCENFIDHILRVVYRIRS